MATVLVMALLALQLADGWTTYRVITRGLGYERNLIVHWLMDHLGVFWALVVLKGWAVAIVAGGWCADWWTGAWLWVLALLVLGYALVIANNTKILRGGE